MSIIHVLKKLKQMCMCISICKYSLTKVSNGMNASLCIYFNKLLFILPDKFIYVYH